jgi:hypothetical protein
LLTQAFSFQGFRSKVALATTIDTIQRTYDMKRLVHAPCLNGERKDFGSCRAGKSSEQTAGKNLDNLTAFQPMRRHEKAR